MAQRNELAVRASAVGFDHTTIANDSKLEQKVLYLEKRQTTISGTAATTTLTSTGVALNNETMTIGGRTYTFKTTLTGAADEILIGAAATNTLDNIKDAINGTSVSGGPGTTYGTGTKPYEDIVAGAKNATTLVIAATNSNSNGALATTETLTNFSFTSTTMSAGTNGSITPPTATYTGAPGLSGDRNVA